MEKHHYHQKVLDLKKLCLNKMERETKSKFIKVRCNKCKNEQIIFGKASTRVNCLVCGEELLEPTGGKSKIKARVLEVLE